jgi:hypothetical protein
LPARFTLPVEIGIDDYAFWHERCAVALVEGRIVSAFHLIAEHRRVPFQLPGVGAGVGVEQQFIPVEAVSVLRLIRPVDPVSVKGTRPNIRQVSVKNLVGVFGKLDTVGLAFSALIEQADFNLGGVCRKNREVCTVTIPSRAHRTR